jgi:hypothetical protein
VATTSTESEESTAAFSKEVLQIQPERSHDVVLTSNAPLQEAGVIGFYIASLRAGVSMLPNRLFKDLLAQASVSYWKYVLPSRQSAEVVRKFFVACTVFLDKLILFACHSGCRPIVILGAAR